MAVVRLDGLTKRYDRNHPPAAVGIDLEIADGEFMVLLGPSGCGKTTTLRMVAGLEAITEGTVSIDGRVVNDIPAKNRDIAMVFQSYALYPHMSVRDNLAFGLRRRKMPRVEIDRRVSDAAEILGLTVLLDRKPHALSGGQRQRVAVGRAIVRDPKVFLFDEPLSNLDAALRVSTRAEISALHRRLQATMIYVTHDQVEAMTLGTRICIMNGGRIAQVGRPMEVYRTPADTFVAGFLGNPPMNLLPGTATDAPGGCRLRVGGMRFDIPEHRTIPSAPGLAMTLGLRPERVTVRPTGSSTEVAITGEVVQVEALGAETLVSLRLPDVEPLMIARLPGDSEVAIGTRTEFFADMALAHVFDADGRSMTAQREREET
ncbi:sn-glycerol-3-phosphate ABC transporter ATP-binding protein UgpC [Thalassobaculum sp.]|uniref:ABC transporter ATP-binding protein n=1 Tax=Thalassobaculum sp. TaxID=2022740 RepID=UPI0032EFE37D